jgi:predicted RNase H-like HicB family nuclease
MNILKSQIESLGFEFLHKTKKDGLFYAYSRISGGILIDGKSYEEVLNNIEIYLKKLFPL